MKKATMLMAMLTLICSLFHAIWLYFKLWEKPGCDIEGIASVGIWKKYYGGSWGNRFYNCIWFG